MKTRSVAELTGTAPQNIAIYCDSSSRYAWPHHDVDRWPASLEGLDLLSPAFLSYPIKRDYFEPMLQAGPAGGNYSALLAAMKKVIDETDHDESFEASLAARGSQVWLLVEDALSSAGRCKGLTSVAVTKILHRKRPNLVPIVDKRVRTFYGAKKDDRLLFERIHHDLSTHGAMIDSWAAAYTLPSGGRMTRLRALDIAIWMEGRRS